MDTRHAVGVKVGVTSEKLADILEKLADILMYPGSRISVRGSAPPSNSARGSPVTSSRYLTIV
jgi:hypothetical protein